MVSQIQVDIASPPDREKLVAQLMIGNEQWGELNQEHDTLLLEFYPRQDERPWEIDFNAAIEALMEAKRRLLGE